MYVFIIQCSTTPCLTTFKYLHLSFNMDWQDLPKLATRAFMSAPCITVGRSVFSHDKGEWFMSAPYITVGRSAFSHDKGEWFMSGAYRTVGCTVFLQDKVTSPQHILIHGRRSLRCERSATVSPILSRNRSEDP